MEYPRGTPVLGKLRFAETTLGVKYIVLEDTIAVREEDYPKIREVLSIPDNKITDIAELFVQKELEEIRAEKEKLNKAPEDPEKLKDYEIRYIIDKLRELEHREKVLKKEDEMPLEYVVKAVEIAYKEQKEREKFIEEGDWMEMTR